MVRGVWLLSNKRRTIQGYVDHRNLRVVLQTEEVGDQGVYATGMLHLLSDAQGTVVSND